MGDPNEEYSPAFLKSKKTPISDKHKNKGALGVKGQLGIHWACFNS